MARTVPCVPDLCLVGNAGTYVKVFESLCARRRKSNHSSSSLGRVTSLD